jgi:hypothetical protein
MVDSTLFADREDGSVPRIAVLLQENPHRRPWQNIAIRIDRGFDIPQRIQRDDRWLLCVNSVGRRIF